MTTKRTRQYADGHVAFFRRRWLKGASGSERKVGRDMSRNRQQGKDSVLKEDQGDEWPLSKVEWALGPEKKE